MGTRPVTRQLVRRAHLLIYKRSDGGLAVIGVDEKSIFGRFDVYTPEDVRNLPPEFRRGATETLLRLLGDEDPKKTIRSWHAEEKRLAKIEEKAKNSLSILDFLK